MDNSKRTQSHNLSLQEMKELKYEQTTGTPAMVKANKDSSYEIPAVEQHMVHVSIESPQYNQQTGKKESVPMIQPFYKNEFERMEQEGAFKGYEVKILHMPGDAKADKANTPARTSNATGNDPLTFDERKKAIGKMNKEQLLGEYKTVFGTALEGTPPNNKDLAGTIIDELEKKYELDALIAEYTTLYGEAPIAEIDIEDLREAIESKKGE